MSRASDILRERAEYALCRASVAAGGTRYTREAVEWRAVADLMADWDGAAYCPSCGVRQCEPEHGDEHHRGCKRVALERAITGESE